MFLLDIPYYHPAPALFFEALPFTTPQAFKARISTFAGVKNADACCHSHRGSQKWKPLRVITTPASQPSTSRRKRNSGPHSRVLAKPKQQPWIATLKAIVAPAPSPHNRPQTDGSGTLALAGRATQSIVEAMVNGLKVNSSIPLPNDPKQMETEILP